MAWTVGEIMDKLDEFDPTMLVRILNASDGYEDLELEEIKLDDDEGAGVFIIVD